MTDLHAEFRQTSDKIARLLAKRPTKREATAWRDNVLAACNSALAIAQRLESSASDDSIDVELLRTQLELLSVQVALRDAGAADKRHALVDRVRTTAVPEITTEVWLQDLTSELEQSPRSRIHAHRLAELLQVFSTAHLAWRHLIVARQVLRTFGCDSAAIRPYQEVGTLFAASRSARLACEGLRWEGMARRLSLLGQPIELAGKLLSGESFSLAAYRGRIVLISFWATWCGPCRRELPLVRQLYQQYHERGFDILGISVDDDRHELETFLAEHQIPWPTLFSDDPDHTGVNHPAAVQYGVSGVPTGFLVDDAGTLVSANIHAAELRQELQRRLPSPE